MSYPNPPSAQAEMIGRVLIENGHVSNFDCIHNNIVRLAARIQELRINGWSINTERQPDNDTIYRLIRRGA